MSADYRTAILAAKAELEELGLYDYAASICKGTRTDKIISILCDLRVTLTELNGGFTCVKGDIFYNLTKQISRFRSVSPCVRDAWGYTLYECLSIINGSLLRNPVFRELTFDVRHGSHAPGCGSGKARADMPVSRERGRVNGIIFEDRETPAPVMAHEFMHHVEFRNVGLLRRDFQYIEDGCPAGDVYALNVYKSLSGRKVSTELLAVGVESLFDPHLYVKVSEQMDHVLLVWASLRGY